MHWRSMYHGCSVTRIRGGGGRREVGYGNRKKAHIQNHCDHSDDGAHDRADDGPLLCVVGGGLCFGITPLTPQPGDLGGVHDRHNPKREATQDRAQDCPHEVVVRFALALPARRLALPAWLRRLALPARLLALPTWGTFIGPWRITHGNCLPLGWRRSHANIAHGQPPKLRFRPWPPTVRRSRCA